MNLNSFWAVVVAFWRFPNGKVFGLALYEAHQSSVARMSTAKSVFGWVVVVVEVSEVNENVEDILLSGQSELNKIRMQLK